MLVCAMGVQKETDSGVQLGLAAIHPITGKLVPVYVADYVVGDYGTGAVMGVPGHDSRDYAFAESHHVPIVQVVADPDADPDADAAAPSDGNVALYEGRGVLVNSGKYDGLTSDEATDAILADAEGAGVRCAFLRGRVEGLACACVCTLVSERGCAMYDAVGRSYRDVQTARLARVAPAVLGSTDPHDSLHLRQAVGTAPCAGGPAAG